MADTRYRWDGPVARYRDATTGQFVTEGAVRAAMDGVIGGASIRIQGLSARLAAQQMTLAQWQADMQAILKVLHTSAYMAAHGGSKQMAPADHERLAAVLKGQYQFLTGMARDVASGRQPLNGTLPVRAQLYAEAARGTFEDQRRIEQQVRGLNEERRILHPADHCDDCVAAARRDWQPLGTLPRIGDSQCLVRCHCTMEFRRGDPAEPVATPPAAPAPAPIAPPIPPAQIRAAMEEFAAGHEARVDVARDRINTAWNRNFDLAEELGKLLETGDLPPPSDPRVRSLNRRIDASAKEITRLKAARDKLRDSLDEQIREKYIYHPGAPADPNVHLQGGTEAERAIWREGTDAFRRIVGYGHEIDGKHVTIRESAREAYEGSGRSYYNGSTVNMDEGSRGVRTVIHELGHWLEEEGGLHDETMDHLRSRTRTEAPVKLRDLKPGSGYRDDEISRPDKFYRPYMGKDYGGHATELLSMALENMYADPLDFARKDPATFDWAMNMLRRKNRR